MNGEGKIDFLSGTPHLAAVELNKIKSVRNGSEFLVNLWARGALAGIMRAIRVDDCHAETASGTDSCYTLEIVRKPRGSSERIFVRCPYCQMPCARLFHIIHIFRESSERKIEQSFACWDCVDPKMIAKPPLFAGRLLLRGPRIQPD